MPNDLATALALTGSSAGIDCGGCIELTWSSSNPRSCWSWGRGEEEGIGRYVYPRVDRGI